MIFRLLVFGLLGAALGLGVGLVAIVLAPDDGFGDLAAAAVTVVLLIPAGLVVGVLIGWWTARKRARAS